MNNFFKHNDKVYSENLNDSVLVGNAFSWSISIDLPTDSDGLFPAGSDVVKAKVADVYATPNSNLGIGSTIENSSGSSQVYRLTVYPNFNRFGGFTFVSLEGDGSVIIAEKGGTSPVRNNLDYANLGNVTELKTLREYDLVVTIPSGGVVTGLGFGFQSTTGGANASISQANVAGLVDDLSSLESGKADTEHSHTTSTVVERNALSHIGTSVNDSQSVVNEAVDEKVGSLSTSIANLVQVQEVAVNMGTISSGGNVTKTASVTACPTGYSSMILVKTTSWCVCSASSLTGTTLSVTGMNLHSGSHTCWISVYVVYYPSAWSI